MSIVLWIIGVVLVGVAWFLNMFAKVQLGSGNVESAKTFQSLALTATSTGFGWLIAQIILYFLK